MTIASESRPIEDCSDKFQSNPFATRFVRPDVMPYFFDCDDQVGSADSSMCELVKRFSQNRYFGQLVGPHGSGKTTLGFAIARELRESFSFVDYATIRPGGDVNCERKWFCDFVSGNQGLMILDGIERLSFLQQRLLIHNVLSGRKRKSGCKRKSGLLLTTHRPLRFCPIVKRVEASVDGFKQVVNHLAPGIEMPDEVAIAMFEESNGNVRESLMLAYNWAERK